MNKTKVAYISGPISGLVNGNADNFMKAQKKLESEGYIVVNPHEICKDIYDKWSKITRPEEKVAAQNYDKEMWVDFMKRCIAHLVTCDCVFVLENWETSKGSKVELFNAQKLLISIYYMKDYSEFDIMLEISKVERIPM